MPAEDRAVYDMICDADTVGVFQIESRAQMTMLPRLRPRCFYDLVIEVAIVRPGPIQGDMVHPYLRRREGLEPVVYPSQALGAVLGRTLGVPLFQEQVMQGGDGGGGIHGRGGRPTPRGRWPRGSGTGSWSSSTLSSSTACSPTATPPTSPSSASSRSAASASTASPRATPRSFALLVYVSAWLKRHHPAAFACALLNSQPMGFYAPAQIVRDAQEHGVEVRPVDVNASEWDCTLEPSPSPAVSTGDAAEGAGKRGWGRGGPAVRLGFRMVKGLRRGDAERVLTVRKDAGTFAAMTPFTQTTGLRPPALRRLADADAFSSMGLSRRQAVWRVMECRDEPPSLFEDVGTDQGPPVELPAMPLAQEVTADYRAAGLSLKRHPVSFVRDALAAMEVLPAARLAGTPHGRWVGVAGLVLVRQRPGTASGIVFVTLEDETGVANLVVHPGVYDRYRQAARHAAFVRADGRVERDGQVVHVLTSRLRDLTPLLQGCQTRSRDFH